MALLAVPVASCGSGSGANAVLNTAIGVGAGAVQRARGGCYSACAPGTACNRKTGFCESLPCDGRCRVDEICVPTPTAEQCVPKTQQDLWGDDAAVEPDSVPAAAEPQPAPREKTSDGDD